MTQEEQEIIDRAATRLPGYWRNAIRPDTCRTRKEQQYSFHLSTTLIRQGKLNRTAPLTARTASAAVTQTGPRRSKPRPRWKRFRSAAA